MQCDILDWILGQNKLVKSGVALLVTCQCSCLIFDKQTVVTYDVDVRGLGEGHRRTHWIIFATFLQIWNSSKRVYFVKETQGWGVLGRAVHEADLGFGRVREMHGKAGAVSVGTRMLGWGIFTLIQMDKLESSFEGNHSGRRYCFMFVFHLTLWECSDDGK